MGLYNYLGEEVCNYNFERLFERFTPEQIEILWYANFRFDCSCILFADISPKIMRLIIDDMDYHKLSRGYEDDEKDYPQYNNYNDFYFLIGRIYYKDSDVELVKKILRYGKKFFADYGTELSRNEAAKVLKIVSDEYYKKKNGQENKFDYYRDNPWEVKKKMKDI